MIPLCAIGGPSSEHLHGLYKSSNRRHYLLSTMPSSNYNTDLATRVMALCPTRVRVLQEALAVSSAPSPGFSPRHSDSHLKRVRKNMESAYVHKQVVGNYLQKELFRMGRVAVPFARSLVPHGQISRFGVVSQHHKPDSN